MVVATFRGDVRRTITFAGNETLAREHTYNGYLRPGEADVDDQVRDPNSTIVGSAGSDFLALLAFGLGLCPWLSDHDVSTPTI